MQKVGTSSKKGDVLVAMSEEEFAHITTERDGDAMVEQANEAVRRTILTLRTEEQALIEKYPELAKHLGFPPYVSDEIVRAATEARENAKPVMIAFIKGGQLADTKLRERYAGGARAETVELPVYGGHGAQIGWAFSNAGEGEAGNIFVALTRRGADYWRSLRQPRIDSGYGFDRPGIRVVENDVHATAE